MGIAIRHFQPKQENVIVASVRHKADTHIVVLLGDGEFLVDSFINRLPDTRFAGHPK